MFDFCLVYLQMGKTKPVVYSKILQNSSKLEALEVVNQKQLTSSLLSSLSLICLQNTGNKTARHCGNRKIFESTKSLMQIIFDWLSRPAGIVVIIVTRTLLKW
jgi:hypothetical protein